MPTKVQQRDREFVRDVGIRLDGDDCDMCQLTAIERHRRLADLMEAAGCIALQRAQLNQKQQTINMWRLATFTAGAIVVMLLCAFFSVHGGRA